MKHTNCLLRSFLASLVLVFTRLHLAAFPGDLDLSFDPGSTVNGGIPVRAMAVQSDGRVIIVGDFTTAPGAMRSGIARLNLDGMVDPAFAPAIGGNQVPRVSSLALLDDGRVLIGGYFTSVNGIARSYIARLNADGSLDDSFLNALAGPNKGVGGIMVQKDGKILIGGDFTSINGIPRTNFARLNADGSLDTSFLNGLPGPNRSLSSVVAQEDGKILIGGSFTSVNGVIRTNVARLNPDGSLDETFLNGLSGPGPGDWGWTSVIALAVQVDGKVLVAGIFGSFNGTSRTNLVRLNTDGSVDQSFLGNIGGWVHAFPVQYLTLQPDGKILIGGAFNSVLNGQARRGMARLNSDGSLDPSFLANMDSRYTELGVYAIALQGEDKILVGGAFSYQTATSLVRYLCRLNLDGSLDNTFYTRPTGPDDAVYRLAAQPDGRIVIGGQFTGVDGIPQGGVSRLLPNGSLDDTFLEGVAGADRNVFALAVQGDGRILVGGEFGAMNGVPRLGVARLAADGSLDNSFVNDLGGYVYALGLQPDGKIIAGGGWRTNSLARLNPDGSTDTSFLGNIPPDGGTVWCLARQDDGKILVGGTFSVVDGTARGKLARLNPDGSLDTVFLAGLAGPNQSVNCLAIQNDGKILIGGSFYNVNGVARYYLARLNPNGSLDPSFLYNLVGPDGGVNSVSLQSDGKILVGGGFQKFNGVARQNLVRLNPDGSLDNAFLAGPLAIDNTVQCVLFQPNGRILISGQFTAVNQTPRSFVARLLGDYAPPTILQAPQSRTAEVGSNLRFTVDAIGSPPPRYQWYRDDSPLAGGTTTILTLPNVQLPHSGAYTVAVTNEAGSVTSPPAMLNVIAPVERRSVPGLKLNGEIGAVLNLEFTDAMEPSPSWLPLDTVTMTTSSRWSFDLASPAPPQRFYRAWQPAPATVVPTLDLQLIPALTLTGTIGEHVRVDYINAMGPTDAWVTLDTVTLASSPQLYFDVTAPGQPQRLYRIVPVP